MAEKIIIQRSGKTFELVPGGTCGECAFVFASKNCRSTRICLGHTPTGNFKRVHKNWILSFFKFLVK